MKLYEDKPNYVRLDDDVSFQIVRTNPKLTTNTKLMYDGESLYMESYDAAPLLSTLKYKHRSVWKTGLFNRDIKNFLVGTGTTSHAVGNNVGDTIVLDDFDNQFENMYWCGVEAINSEFYPQEMGCIAPLYLRKKRPNYFVIFRVDTPANTRTQNSGIVDGTVNFYSDILNNARIIKTFDLRESTPIGQYIKRYVEQRNFRYDQSIYMNFASHEIYYYGIDKSTGVLAQKVENFEDQLLNNDNTIIKSDEWITGGFERNNLIFPYIMNIEFLFDDKEIGEYKFARYFGMYCNDIDLYDLDVKVGASTYDPDYDVTSLVTNEEDGIVLPKYGLGYIKDKYNNLHTFKNYLTDIQGTYRVPGKVNLGDLSGFESSSVSAYVERIDGYGKAFIILDIVGNIESGEELNLSINSQITTFRAYYDDPGASTNNLFSYNGEKEDVAKALATAIRSVDNVSESGLTVFNIGNKVIIQSTSPGTFANNMLKVSGDLVENLPVKINKLSDSFCGGTDIEGCLFKAYTSDKDMFFDTDTKKDRDPYRYFKCTGNRNNAKILNVLPYINENNEIDDTYSLLVSDEQGQYVGVANTGFVEIVDKFYPKVGVLSLFPVRDFDFDTLSSAYGNYKMIDEEFKKFKEDHKQSEDEDSGNNEPDNGDSDGPEYVFVDTTYDIPYKRFYDDAGNDIDTEYDYYCENLLPTLVTVSKSAPYIVKWGYIDESKDSCENPYRLNTSKIFESCNFSANTYLQKGDIIEFTHSMPYYIVEHDVEESGEITNEYQYIKEKNIINENSLDKYFSDSNVDRFDEVFGDVYSNKRFNKKYSRFLNGDTIIKSSTLFRGVKFEITELLKGKEIRTGKYNGYKFSFIYIPKTGTKDDNIYFIKNDTFKFIVGIIYFDTQVKVDEFNKFNKAYVYSGSMGFLKEK